MASRLKRAQRGRKRRIHSPGGKGAGVRGSAPKTVECGDARSRAAPPSKRRTVLSLNGVQAIAGAKCPVRNSIPSPQPSPFGRGSGAPGWRPPLRPAMSPHEFLAAGRARPRRRALSARRLPLRAQRRARQMAGRRLRRRPDGDAAFDRRRDRPGADDRVDGRRPVRLQPLAAADRPHPRHGGGHPLILSRDALSAARRCDDFLYGLAADRRRAVGAAARRAGRTLPLGRSPHRLRRRAGGAAAVAFDVLLGVAAGAVRRLDVRARSGGDPQAEAHALAAVDCLAIRRRRADRRDDDPVRVGDAGRLRSRPDVPARRGVDDLLHLYHPRPVDHARRRARAAAIHVDRVGDDHRLAGVARRADLADRARQRDHHRQRAVPRDARRAVARRRRRRAHRADPARMKATR